MSSMEFSSPSWTTGRRLSRRTLLLGLLGLVVAGCARGSGLAGQAVPATTARKSSGPTRISYGSDRSQFGDLYLPGTSAATVPVVVLIHGGGWQSGYTLAGLAPHAKDLLGRGVAVWNIEYRAVGNGGGWPGTFQDVAAAVDALATDVQAAAQGRLDLSRVRVVGHSAGGHLAVWAAGRPSLPSDAPGARPAVMVEAAVGLAPVLDLQTMATYDDPEGNVSGLIGGSPTMWPQRYIWASPTSALPLGLPVTCVHGDADETVPVSQSVQYVAAATAAGDPAHLEVLSGIDHNAVVDLGGRGWALARTAALIQS